MLELSEEIALMSYRYLKRVRKETFAIAGEDKALMFALKRLNG
jgi:hypothetical protein